MSTAAPQPQDVDSDKVAASALDFLLIELVPLAHRMATELQARDAALMASSSPLATADSLSTATTALKEQRLSLQSADATASAKGTATLNAEDDDVDDDDADSDSSDEDTREAMLWRLDALGYRVGQGLVERFSANAPRPATPLDMIKFICKDLWTLVFRKQIDNLKTNHRGTFVLTDARFLMLTRMSVDTRRGPRGLEEALAKAQPFLWFPCGVIRGALSGFGLNVSVQAETTELPTAVFQIRTLASSATAAGGAVNITTTNNTKQ